MLLIRHALTDHVGHRLSGRAPAVSLSAAGKAQAQRLGISLAAAFRLSVVYTSPLERARATACGIAARQQTRLAECDGLVEIDFGKWTGLSFAELQEDPAWRLFNARRSLAVVPGGELPRSAQGRAVQTVVTLAAHHPGEVVAAVTHAEVIRLALLHYRSLSLDRYADIAIEPASVSVLHVTDGEVDVQSVNDCSFAG